MKKSIRRFGATLLAVCLLAPVFATGALAAELSGEGEATSLNLARSTMTIRGERYHVTEKTVLRNERGQTVALREFPVEREGRRGNGDDEGDAVRVRFDAVETRRGPALLSVQIIPMPQ